MISAERVKNIIYNYHFFIDKPIFTPLSDNKVQIEGICAWCCGCDGQCQPCDGIGILTFEDDDEFVIDIV
jgi:hypothetical protein